MNPRPAPGTTTPRHTVRHPRTQQRPYTPHHDLQGISDERELERIKASIPGYANL
ncbi:MULTISPECIES: hypothetical protein [unclassified Streptomyces]|uniref:hypothetical protein n=1 Tax=unclassified Streptomyces TaxID=2593676 RepID=UPI0033BCD6FB